MCSSKGWSVKGSPALQETVAEGKNMTIFLGISSEGDYIVVVKDGFFYQYITHYFFKLFLERVLSRDRNWPLKNTITLDNSKVQKNHFNCRKLLLEWQLSVAFTAPYSVSFFIINHFQPTGSPVELAFSANKRAYKSAN